MVIGSRSINIEQKSVIERAITAAPEVGVRASFVAFFNESFNEDVAVFRITPCTVDQRNVLSFEDSNSDLIWLHWLWLYMPVFEAVSLTLICLVDLDPTSNSSLG